MSTRSTKSSPPPKTISEKLFELVGERYIPHQSLGRVTGFQVGGVADHLVYADSISEVIEVATLAVAHDLPYRVLGRGTNTLASDFGYPGIVIINRCNGLSFVPGSSRVLIESGMTNDQLLSTAASRNLGGVEFLAAIPGTIGGAVCTNATWNDTSVSTYLREASLLIFEQGKGKTVSVRGDELSFQPYGSALLNNFKHPPILLTAQFQLVSLPQEEVIRRLLAVRKQVKRKRTILPALGYIFKTPLGRASLTATHLRRFLVDGVRFSRDDIDVLEKHSSKVTAQSVIDTVQALKSFLEQSGLSLDDRLTHLRYLPDESTGERA